MSGNNVKKISKTYGNNGNVMRKVHMFKDTATDVIKDAYDFDTTVISSNDEYIEKLKKADSAEYDILKLNMEKAETEEERDKIRKRVAEMQQERYRKDTENKSFYMDQQEGHRNHNLKILGSLAVVSGLVYKFRKPIINAGKKLITKL